MGQRQGHQAPSGGERPERGNLYEEVTARVVAELEQGRVPWVQPWGSAKTAIGLPRNGLSGQRYSGRPVLA
jgi:antirestriction protein ArdC